MLVNFNRHLELEIESLREENDMLRRMLFGKKSEKIVCEKIGIEEEEQPPMVRTQDKGNRKVPPHR